jgi:hypothetical protein
VRFAVKKSLAIRETRTAAEEIQFPFRPNAMLVGLLIIVSVSYVNHPKRKF